MIERLVMEPDRLWERIGKHLFRDSEGMMGRLAYLSREPGLFTFIKIRIFKPDGKRIQGRRGETRGIGRHKAGVDPSRAVCSQGNFTHQPQLDRVC